MSTKHIDALKLALEALERHAELGLLAGSTITAIREALADSALDRMAENARELGLDYEPPCKTGSQCTSKCQQCEQPAQQREPVACQPRGLIDIGRVFTPEKAEEPKPVAWKKKGAFHFCNQPPVDVEKWIPLYKSHTQHWQTWAGLTDEELREIEKEFQAERVRTSDEEYLIIYPSAYWSWMKAIEAKLKEKNA